MNKAIIRTIQIISVSLVIIGGFVSTTLGVTYPARCKDGRMDVCQELAAKEYLFKHSPNKGGGMPQPAPWKNQAEKRQYEHKVVSEAIKQTSEIASWFLQAKYTGSQAQDTKLYPIVSKLNVLNLTKTDTGFNYSFKSGSICDEFHYTGSLTMDGQRAVADKMEMQKFIIPC